MVALDKIFQKVKEVHRLMGKVEKELKSKRIEVNSGAGMVKVVINGNQDILEVNIDPELINMKDKKLLEDLIISAVNEAKRVAQKEAQEIIYKFGGESNINIQDFRTLFE